MHKNQGHWYHMLSALGQGKRNKIFGTSAMFYIRYVCLDSQISNVINSRVWDDCWYYPEVIISIIWLLMILDCWNGER